MLGDSDDSGDSGESGESGEGEETQTKKDFWVRKFYAEEGFYTYFNNADEILPNIPYIITVPSDYDGEERSLIGKPLVFSASNASVKSGKIVADSENYNFVGSYYGTDIESSYVYKLDEEEKGNNFVYLGSTATIEPFRAYFTSEAEPVEHLILYVASYIDVPTATGINDLPKVDNDEEGNLDGMTSNNLLKVYSITGSLVKTEKSANIADVLRTLPKGIYIINGKKYMR